MSKIYKIVQILNEYDVVINAGFAEGIKTGQLFQIYNRGEEVFDPDTKLSLGTRDNIKAEVRAVEVSEHVTVCRNNSSTPILSKYLATEHEQLLLGLKAITGRTPTPLMIDPAQVSVTLSHDKVVKLGDLVRPLNYD